jgi:hypothetical protein
LAFIANGAISFMPPGHLNTADFSSGRLDRTAYFVVARCSFRFFPVERHHFFHFFPGYSSCELRKLR